MSSLGDIPAVLADGLEALKRNDINGYLEIYASDAVHEFPFAADGAPKKLEGRETIEAYMCRLPNFVKFGHFDPLVARVIGNEVIIEATGHHTKVPSGEPKVLDYVWFFKLRDGKVIHVRDYMNPLQLAQ